jgi:hypothetical protein
VPNLDQIARNEGEIMARIDMSKMTVGSMPNWHSPTADLHFAMFALAKCEYLREISDCGDGGLYAKIARQHLKLALKNEDKHVRRV